MRLKYKMIDSEEAEVKGTGEENCSNKGGE